VRKQKTDRRDAFSASAGRLLKQRWAQGKMKAKAKAA